jgi:hypothetical protein
MYTMGIGGTIAFFCAAWVLYEVWAINKNMTTGYKVLWSISAICLNVFTALAYYFVVKRDTIA